MLINSENVPENKGSNYPEIFKNLVSGRIKKRLGEAANLKNFGVNLVTLQPKTWSSLRHWHSQQDEFIYILEGEVTLITNQGEQILKSGEAAGFPAGEENGHHLINHSNFVAIYLEIGDKSSEDKVTYPEADLVAKYTAHGWIFTHKNGTLY